MFTEVFKHTDPDEYHDLKLTLHDCHAEKTEYKDGILRFYLPDGFWIFPQHEENRYEKILRTDAAIVDFYTENMHKITIHIATVQDDGSEKEEFRSMQELAEAINSGACTLEFITQDKTGSGQIWHCNLHAKKPPFCRFCEIRIPDTHAVFHWNELRPDREW